MRLFKKLSEVKPGETIELSAEERLAIMIYGIASFYPPSVVKMKMSIALEWMNAEELKKMEALLGG